MLIHQFHEYNNRVTRYAKADYTCTQWQRTVLSVNLHQHTPYISTCGVDKNNLKMVENHLAVHCGVGSLHRL